MASCACCGGACCLPEREPCTFVTGPCPEEGDCEEGFICNEDGECEGSGNFPVGECPGSVTGSPIPPECQDGLTRSDCEEQGGIFHPGKTCEQVCCGPCEDSNDCGPGCECLDGECVEACRGECSVNDDCGAECKCCTVFTGGSPGALVNTCLRITEEYACCCESYQQLCFTDMSYCAPGAISGPFPPNIGGSPPANAIVLINSSAVYCNITREIEGYWQGLSGGEPAACYDYGYYTVGGSGDCRDWFDIGGFSASFWGLFCDCATSNDVDVCEANPLP